MMNNEEKSGAAGTAETLKEIHEQATTQHPAEGPSTDPKEIQEQLKGSDADTDVNVGADDQPTPEEAAEQLKGSDADTDK